MTTYNYKWQDCTVEALQVRDGAVGRTGFIIPSETADAGALAQIPDMLRKRGLDVFVTIVDGKSVLAISALNTDKEAEVLGVLAAAGVTEDSKLTENGSTSVKKLSGAEKAGAWLKYQFTQDPARIVGFMGIAGNMSLGYSAHLQNDKPRRAMAWGTNNITAGVALLFGNGMSKGKPDNIMRRLKGHLKDNGFEVPHGDMYDRLTDASPKSVLGHAWQWVQDNVIDVMRKNAINITQAMTIYGSMQEIQSARKMEAGLGGFRELKAWGYVAGAGIAIAGKEGHGESAAHKTDDATHINTNIAPAAPKGFLERAGHFVKNPMFLVGAVDTLGNIIGLLDVGNIRDDLERKAAKPALQFKDYMNKRADLMSELNNTVTDKQTQFSNYGVTYKKAVSEIKELEKFHSFNILNEPLNKAYLKFFAPKDVKEAYAAKRTEVSDALAGMKALDKYTGVRTTVDEKIKTEHRPTGLVGDVIHAENKKLDELSSLNSKWKEAHEEAMYAQQGLDKGAVFYAGLAKILWLMSGSMWMFTKKGHVPQDDSVINHPNDALTSAPVEMLRMMSGSQRQMAMAETASYLANTAKIGRSSNDIMQELQQKLAIADESPWFTKVKPANDDVAVSKPQVAPLVAVEKEPAPAVEQASDVEASAAAGKAWSDKEKREKSELQTFANHGEKIDHLRNAPKETGISSNV